jgi:TolB-like protein
MERGIFYMASARWLLLGLGLSTLSTAAAAATAARPAAPSPSALAVADFSGADRAVGRFIAESLLTGLGQSAKLRLLQCAEVRGAMGALKLPSADQLDAHQVRLLRQRLSAGRIVVGSYLSQDDQMIINVRLLDMQTGLPVPGAAGSVSGGRQELLGLTQRLASRIHQRVTGTELPQDAALSTTSTPTKSDSESWTGLVVDASGLPLQRAMGPRILDEDGHVLYPDPGHVPSTEFLEDRGMVAYVQAGQDTPRSGSRPLVVRVMGVTGPAREDVIVSNEVAEQIRQADQSGGFFARWAVSIVLGAR